MLNIETDDGTANFQFSGQVDYTFQVDGSFISTGGSGDYKKFKTGGSYGGDAAYAFTVNYEPCKGKDCPDSCAVFGDKFKLKKDKFEWKIKNEGKDDLTISSITIDWLGAEIEPYVYDNIPLKKVKLGGKTLTDTPASLQTPPFPGYYSIVDLSGWEGKEKDIQIKSGKQAKLTFEFEDKGISQNPWDYTILVEFAEGCAVTFVAFP